MNEVSELNALFKTPIRLLRIHKGIEENGCFNVSEKIAYFCWRNVAGSLKKFPIHETKEVRCIEESCLRISWGSSFVLKFLLLKAKDQETRDMCIDQIQKAREIVENYTYEESFHSYLTEQFFSLVEDERIANVIKFDKETVKRFADKINFELSPNFLTSTITQEKLSLKEWLDYILNRIYKSQDHLLEERIIDSNPALIVAYANETTKTMESKSFSKFLGTEQKLQEKELIRERNFLQKTYGNNLSTRQFLEYLFSERNEVVDRPALNMINYSMQYPLSRYWIASSHNTYLTGDQFQSESSEEAYVRTLRKGCRCIELDCHPGDNDNIVIYHGMTQTTRISFESVLHTIKEHAFVTSVYPVILSIEDHCGVELQKKMARMFQEIFGELLLVEPINNSISELPSPSELKGKIIIKHKKLYKGETQVRTLSQDCYEEIAVNDPFLGILYRKIENTWIQCMVSLQDSQLFYEEYEEKDMEVKKEDPFTRHWSETWFHGMLAGGCQEGIDILNMTVSKEDGVFLVGTVVDGADEKYHLFIWQDGIPVVYEIIQIFDNNQHFFKLNESYCFRTIYDLITNHQFFPDLCKPPILTNPVPQINAHEKMPWFHQDLSREETKTVLLAINVNGTYLIRKSASNAHDLVLSLWVNNCLKDVKLVKEERGFIVGKRKILFENAVEFIKKCQESPLLGIVLSNPVSRDRATSILSFSKSKNSAICDVLRQDSHEEIQRVRSYTETGENDWPNEEGCMELRDVQLELLQNNTSCCYPFGFSLNSSVGNIEFYTNDKEKCAEWMIKISKAIEDAGKKTVEVNTTHAIASELSDLIIYCQSARFKESDHLQNGGNPVEVYSHNEKKMSLLRKSNPHQILNFHKKCLSRIYPHGLRLNSSNYDPLPFWISGCQMVALNYQTGDLSTEINDAWFERGGRCGYVLKPDSHFIEIPDPNSITSHAPFYIEIIVLGARNLNLPNKKGQQTATVKMKVIGHPKDMARQSNNSKAELEGTALSMTCFSRSMTESQPKKKAKKRKFIILYPEYALLRFSVWAQNALTKLVPVGQAIYLVEFLREGYKSVPLKNDHSEKIHLSSLLIHIRVWRRNEINLKMRDLEKNLTRIKSIGRERIKRALQKLKEVEEIFTNETNI